MAAALKMIAARYPRCRAMQLTCFRTNTKAAALYKSLGFEPTGAVDQEFGEPNYKLSGVALAKFRSKRATRVGSRAEHNTLTGAK